MNFFPFHIGDYLVHTRHLSLMEDLAYRRTLDLYYTRDGVLPETDAEIARLIGMREHVADVSAVMLEFFPGRKNKRADEEIAKYLEAEPEREMRRENERERQRRSRDRRKELFDILRAAGEVPAFDTPMQTLQTMVDRVKSQAVTRDDTGNQVPIPNTNTKEKEKRPRKARATPLPDDFGISMRVSVWAQEKGYGVDDRVANLEAFLSYAKRKGATYVDWDEALMTAIREDWAKARAPKSADIARTTVPYRPNEGGYLANLKPLTPEERAASDAVRLKVMANVKTIGRAA